MSREQDKRIKVGVRIRPSLKRERYDTMCARKTDDERVTITNEDSTSGSIAQDYRFDYCFDESDDQRGVYEEAAQEMIDHGLDGCNATIFTYGQTGAGKTFTILGEMGAQGELTTNSGIFLRVFDDLFNYRDRVKAQKHVVISLAAIEIYVDEVMDLLNNKQKIRLRESGEDTLMPGVSSCVCNNMADVVEYFNIANSFRSVTATKMNDESSRSHAIFFIDLFQQASSFAPRPPLQEELYQPDGSPTSLPGMVRSRIALVDLAGSERVKRSGVEGQGMVEAQAINKSLSTLGTVINSMYEGSKHIPFRESKLTRILRPSFTDKTSRLLLIGQLAPASESYQESLGTLRFCDRVKTMKVATASPFIDPEEEHQYLQSLKDNEQITADIRIARCLHFYQPQRWRSRARNAGWGKIGLQQYVDQVAPQLRAESAGKEELELQQAINKTQKEVFEEMQKELKRREEIYQQLSREMKHVGADLDVSRAEMAKFNEESSATSEAKLTEAKKAKKQRLHLEEKIEKLKKSIKKEGKKGKEADEQLAQVQQKQRSDFDDEDDPEMEEWNQFEQDWKVCEANHNIVETFHTLWSDLTKAQKQYLRRVRGNTDGLEQIEHLRMMSSTAWSDSLINDIIEFTIERAVHVSEGVIQPNESYAWFDIDGCSKRLKNSQVWYPPLDVATHGAPIPRGADVEAHQKTTLDDSDDDESPNAGSKAAAAGQNSARRTSGGKTTSPNNGTTNEIAPSAAQNNNAAKETVQTNQGGTRKMKGNASTKKHDVAEADKHYLMSVYDSPTLVSDVHKYLASGTVMLKHGRSGKPHRRKFWISNISLSRELIWVDPENYPGSSRNAIAINDIASVTLGQYSKVFKRNLTQVEKEFYLSFTISLKDGSRTLDIVADSLVDFEAWVLGICHLAKVDPKWGKPMDTKNDECAKKVSAKELKLLEANHVSPTSYMKVKSVVSEHRDEVAMHMRLFGNNVEQVYDAMGGIHLPQVNHMGAVLMTKGELRFYCSEANIDIFRVCKVWQLFNDMHLVYDPSFTPATNFNTTVAGS